MVDSGAEVNLIGVDALDLVAYTSIECPLGQLHGCGGKVPIESWVQIAFDFPHGAVSLVCGCVSFLRSFMILGQPFLHEVQAVPHFAECYLETRLGSLALIHEPSFSLSLALLQLTDLSPEDRQRLEDRTRDLCLSSAHQQALFSILLEFASTWTNERRGLASTLEHRIILTTPRPIVDRPRRHPPELLEVAAKEIKEMLAQGVIRPSCSPYAAEIVLVQKKADKGGGIRFCIDYRRLNQHTVPDRHPLPRIDDLLRQVRRSRHFISLDLRAGYWQIPMAQESIPKTAFRFNHELYEFLVMPFGLCNAPATFQRAMEQIFGDLQWSGVLVYLDDILIHAPTEETLLTLFREVLRRLQEHNLTMKLEKCFFAPSRIDYLGHVLSAQGLQPNLRKVEVLQKWKVPKTVSELRSLLGFLGYYRQYIDHYAIRTAPLTDLLKKGSRLQWNDELSSIVDGILGQLALVTLTNPIESDEFRITSDASERGVGAELACRSKTGDSWRPVMFASHKFCHRESNWPSYEREAFAIVFALEKFDSFVRGREIEVVTDCSSLVWLKDAKGKVGRWASRLSEYRMRLVHTSGSKIPHVDYISRNCFDDDFLADRMVWALQFPQLAEVQQLQSEFASQVQGKAFMRRDGWVYYRNRIWVPPPLRHRIIHASHSMAPYYHPGYKKTKSIIMRVFCWPRIDEDVAAYVKACLACQRIRPGTERLQGLLKPHPVVGVFDRVYIDTWKCTFGQPRCVVTMLDYATRWVECCITSPSPTSAETAQAFLTSWCCRYGFPQAVMTDNGAEFKLAFDRLCAQLGVQRVRTAVYHPEGNAPIETFHRHLRKGLAHFRLGSDLEFETALHLVLLMYRSLPHLGTGETPAFALFGKDVRPLVQEDWRSSAFPAERDRLRYLLQFREDLRQRAISRLQMLQAQLNLDRSPVMLKLGQLVLVRRRSKSDKLEPLWSLPYRVTHTNQEGTVGTLQSLHSGKIKSSVHVQDCRVLNPPVSQEQLAEWERAIAPADEDFSRKYRARASLLGGECDVPSPELLQQRNSTEIIEIHSDSDKE
jgi:transposase InsO family protein